MQVEAEFSATNWSRNSYIARNFHVVSTCSSGNGRLRRVERLQRQVQHHRAVLADRVEHHRLLALGDRLAQDLDALGLEALKVCCNAVVWVLRRCYARNRIQNMVIAKAIQSSGSLDSPWVGVTGTRCE